MVLLYTWATNGFTVDMGHQWFCSIHGPPMVLLYTWATNGFTVDMGHQWYCSIHGPPMVLLYTWATNGFAAHIGHQSSAMPRHRVALVCADGSHNDLKQACVLRSISLSTADLHVWREGLMDLHRPIMMEPSSRPTSTHARTCTWAGSMGSYACPGNHTRASTSIHHQGDPIMYSDR